MFNLILLPRLSAAPLTAVIGLLACMTACNASGTPDRQPAPPAAVANAGKNNDQSVDQAALINEISATLQACSYDGEPVRFKGSAGSAPSDCRDMVARIMSFTGLPQNFVVVEADVPNAAAAILLDEQRIPQRVIAFNPRFINVVREATNNNAWAPVSIMAHEIGHHLSGHTMTPGGSHPPTELEADKFSGFVMYKMGAALGDAQTALAALVPDGPDGKTHPGRGKRLNAVREGWQQACVQQHGTCRDEKMAATNAAPPESAEPRSKVIATGDSSRRNKPAESLPSAPSPASQLPNPQQSMRVATAVQTAAVDHLPVPGSIPSKFDRFIYDEFGVLDAGVRGTFEAKFREHAEAHGVEIVTLLVRDLHGMKADAYALAMMRQLRVGKLDVGNGAVIVVAPEEGVAAVAWGPGIARQMGSSNPTRSLGSWINIGWPLCVRNQACGNWTENLLITSDHIRRDTDEVEWTIRYQSIAEMMQARDQRPDDGSPDPTSQTIASFDATVVARDIQDGYTGAFVNTVKLGANNAVHVETGDGYTLMLYVVPGTESLMPGGKLESGKRYRFIARSSGLTHNKNDTQEFELLSYAAVQ